MLEQESSLLRRPLPPPVAKVLEERGITEEQVVVATDTDLDITGEYSISWVIVTKEQVLVLAIEEEDNEVLVLKEMQIADIETARTDTRVGSGFLEAKINGVFEELVRFSNKNADKFAKAAAKLKSLAEGKQVEVVAEEPDLEGRCQKCGCRLPDKHSSICPKCLKRGAVFMRFLANTRDYWPWTALAMVLVLLTIALSLVPAQLTKILVDGVFLGNTEDTPGWFTKLMSWLAWSKRQQWLWILVGALALTHLCQSIVGALRERLSVWIANRLGYDLRRQVFQKFEEMAVRYHDTHPVGRLMTRCSQDIEALQNFFTQLTSGFGAQIILVIAVALVMFMTSAKLAVWAILPAPVVMAATIIYYRFNVPRWRKFWTARSSLANTLHGALNGIRVVKAFAQEAREAKRYDSYSSRFRDSGLRVGFAAATFFPIMGWMFQWGSYFVCILNEEMSPGTLIMFLTYLGMFYAPLNHLTQMSNWFTQFTTQAHRVFEVLDEEPEIEELPDAVDMELQGAIAFKDVTFGYDPNIPVLHDVTFQVRPGEMLGIVGHSGSGKSTVVNLIMRFYDATEGVVTIDNIDIRKIRKLCLRRQIGIVAQDPFLFRGSVAENIAYGNPRVAPERVLDAALAANAHMFITRIHDGYDTRLGEHGSGLSGGERQRVAIARALLHNPRILILDEATSSVDTIAEREIQKALEALSLGRTTIAIAHRLSTLRNCDRILVFEEGRVREQGSHEELMALHGIYRKLVDIQTQLATNTLADVDSPEALATLTEEPPAAAARELRAKEREKLQVPHIRYLNPKYLHVYSMDEGGMRITYRDEVHEHARAYRCFPLSRPSEFIALWVGESALEHKEVGMIRRLKELAPSSRLAVQHELAKRYFIHYISKIVSIKEDVGFLNWRVETDKGDMEFMTKRFDHNSVVEGGPNGRIIIDVDSCRYEIEDLDALDAASRSIFLRYIYW